ncbi:MAG TPA: transcription antitermination factor NusB [Planctomycetaceae bacterium]|nr:transcription antitermination factor NusB [Planctomycetaceae bacterium]
MARRSRAREVALQLLYALDLNPQQHPDTSEEFLARRLHRDRELIQFARSLVAGVQRNREEIDELLGARAQNWTLDRMAATDRNILRLGAYEIVYTDAPPRVAINEAVELAKRFGTRHSAQFVNGVLDRVMHDFRPNDSS